MRGHSFHIDTCHPFRTVAQRLADDGRCRSAGFHQRRLGIARHISGQGERKIQRFPYFFQLTVDPFQGALFRHFLFFMVPVTVQEGEKVRAVFLIVTADQLAQFGDDLYTQA